MTIGCPLCGAERAGIAETAFDMSFSQATGELSCGSRSVTLTRLQSKIMSSLMIAQPAVVRVDTLASVVWPKNPPSTETQTIRVVVTHLRKKIKEIGSSSDIKAIWGRGYVLMEAAKSPVRSTAKVAA